MQAKTADTPIELGQFSPAVDMKGCMISLTMNTMLAALFANLDFLQSHFALHGRMTRSTTPTIQLQSIYDLKKPNNQNYEQGHDDKKGTRVLKVATMMFFWLAYLALFTSLEKVAVADSNT